MRLGSLQLTSNLFLSPLAGYTNLPFRLVVREIGGVGLCTTDLVNARSLLEKRAKAFKLIETRPEDSPLAVQLFGSVPEEMRDAAQFLAARGVASIDINMGCPVRKVCQVGGGSAMMTELDKTAALVRGMVDAVKIPVTAKMRLGWDDANLTAPDLARALEAVGVAAIFVHGRTRAQGFGGTVNLAGIRAVVQAVKTIPVIGNGDVTTPEAAKRMLDETGCAGVSIGRGAFYDPWIFKRTHHFLKSDTNRSPTTLPHPGPLPLGEGAAIGPRSFSITPPANADSSDHQQRTAILPLPAGEGRGEGEPASDGQASPSPEISSKQNPAPGSKSAAEIALLPEPSFDERVRVMCRHFDLMMEIFGEELGCRMFRKIAPQYSRRFGPANEFNKHVVLVASRAQFHEILENYRRWRAQFLDDQGELLPRFRPPPMVASFMQDATAAPAAHVPVPKGPVEMW